MATTLPSFVELMATLGLSDPADSSDQVSASRHSRSSSHSSSISLLSASSSIVPTQPSNIYSFRHSPSPAIVVSSHEGSPERDVACDIRRSRATTRYSPYGSIVSPCAFNYAPQHPDVAQSHSRKASMPVLNAEITYERPIRALSTSPRLSPISTSFRGRRARRPENLPLSDADLMAYTPISSYVRRKTPQNSPTSPTFARDRDSAALAHPLTIPALPTLLSPASFTTQSSSDSEDDDMEAVPENAFRLGQLPLGMPSPPWQSRYCDSGVSPRTSLCAPILPDESALPQAVPIA